MIATGRLYQAIKPFAELFKLTDEVVTYQGSGVYDLKTDSIILSNEIESELAVELYQYMYKTYGEITSPILFYDVAHCNSKPSILNHTIVVFRISNCTNFLLLYAIS